MKHTQHWPADWDYPPSAVDIVGLEHGEVVGALAVGIPAAGKPAAAVGAVVVAHHLVAYSSPHASHQ
jgi:uncharacterized membrane protein YphA (DoxX/SURF4 family)